MTDETKTKAEEREAQRLARKEQREAEAKADRLRKQAERDAERLARKAERDAEAEAARAAKAKAQAQAVADAAAKAEAKAMAAALALEGVSAGAYVASDAGNMQRLLALFGADLRYCPGLGWLRWSGARWKTVRRPTTEMVACAELVRAEGAKIGGEPGKALEAWGRVSGNASKVFGAIELAEGERQFEIEIDALDADPWLLNCPNGTVDLRTGELRPHRREDLCLKMTGVAFEPNAACPRFARFMLEIFGDDRSLAAHVLTFLGHALTGCAADRVLLVFHGAGKNGKSTLLDLIAHIFGDYAHTLAVGLLMQRRNARSSAAASPDLAALRGVRFLHGVETSAAQTLDESMVKRLTGGDRIRARHLNREEIEFGSTWKIALATNHRPIVRGTDAAIWDRLHLIPFDVRFDADAGQVPERGLTEALRAEAPGILALLVRACLEWQRCGLAPPKRVVDAVAEYRASQNTLGQFLAECMVPGPSILKSEMWSAFKHWSEQGNEFNPGKKIFNRQIGELGIRDNGKADRHAAWVGLVSAPSF